MNASDHLRGLVGSEIRTAASGRPNRILRIEGEDVIVATSRSPDGHAVPIKWVQEAMDILESGGGVTIDVETVGYRSPFNRRCAADASRRHGTPDKSTANRAPWLRPGAACRADVGVGRGWSRVAGCERPLSGIDPWRRPWASSTPLLLAVE